MVYFLRVAQTDAKCFLFFFIIPQAGTLTRTQLWIELHMNIV